MCGVSFGLYCQIVHRHAAMVHKRRKWTQTGLREGRTSMEHRKHALKKRWLAAVCAVVVCIPLAVGIAFADTCETHTWDTSTAEWTWNGNFATVYMTCTEGDGSTTQQADGYTDTDYEATCTTGGYTLREATVTIDGVTATTSKVFKETDALGHTLTKTAATDATCTTDGNIEYYTCSVCGAVFADEDATTEITAYTDADGNEVSIEDQVTVAATGHDYEADPSTWVLSEDKTTATITLICQNDSTHTLGATAIVTSEVTPASCLKQGYTTYTGEIDIDKDGVTDYTVVKYDDYTDATGHTYDDGVVTTEATCTSEGVMTYTCTACEEGTEGHTYTKAIPVIEHGYVLVTEADLSDYAADEDYTDVDGLIEVKDATCTETGISSYYICSYELSDVTTTEGEGDAAVTTTTTTYTGAYYTATTTTAEDGTETTTYTEVTADDLVIDAKGHTFSADKKTEALDPTCTTAGNIAYYTCTVCGKAYATATEVTGEDGTVTLTDITEISLADTVLEKLDHDPVIITEQVDATCTEDGQEASTYCARCNTTWLGDTIAATGHDYDYSTVTWGEWTQDETTGEYSITATVVCKNDSSHVENLTVTVESTTVDATCTTDGYTIYTATATDVSQVDSEGNPVELATTTKTVAGGSAKGHTWGDEESQVSLYWGGTDDDPDYTVAYADVVCDVCGAKATTAVPVVVYTSDATCQIAGTVTYTATYGVRTLTYTAIDAVVEHTESVMTKVEAVAATCTVAGSIEYYTCNFEDDDAIYVLDEDGTTFVEYTGDTAVAALGHSYNVVEAVAATCTEAGNIAYIYCDRCGAYWTATASEDETEYYVETTDAQGNTTKSYYALGDAIVDITDAQGNVTSTIEDQITVAATGHTWVADTGDGAYQAATCTEDGYQNYTCSVCGATKTETLEATGHDIAGGTKVEALDPTCTTDGHIEYYICGTCGAYLTATEVETTDEDGNTVISYTDVTEVEDVTIAALLHNYVATETTATCTEGGTTLWVCERCGESYYTTVGATGHTAGEAVVENEVAATCGASGSYDEVVYCTVCGAELSRVTVTVPATGEHSYEATTTDATCTEDGVITYTCSVCGDTYSEVIAATGHTAGEAVVENEVAATCSASGSYDEVVYCTVCGAELSRVTVTVAATGEHNYVAKVTDPTCTDLGYTTYTCSVCGDTYTADYTAATGVHSYVAVVTDPTCTELGYTTYTCSVCGTSYTGDYTAATGHSYTSEVTTAATCTEDGVKTYTCSSCGDTYTEAIAATGHDYVKTDVAATCADAGYSVYTCTVCGDTYTVEGEAATGNHTYTSEVTTEATATTDGVLTYTCSVCGDTYTEAIPATGEEEASDAAVTSAEKKAAKKNINTGISIKVTSGKKVKITWGEVANADGYEVYVSNCDKSGFTLAKTVSSSKLSLSLTKVNGTKVKLTQSYKAKVRAYRYVNGKKKYLCTSYKVHGAGSKYSQTNTKKVTASKTSLSISKGSSKKVTVTVTKAKKSKKLLTHKIAKVRYFSMDESIATVNANGKITGKGKGTTYVYAVGVNGVKTKIKVKVS